jgi:hypothetical protein
MKRDTLRKKFYTRNIENGIGNMKLYTRFRLGCLLAAALAMAKGKRRRAQEEGRA